MNRYQKRLLKYELRSCKNVTKIWKKKKKDMGREGETRMTGDQFPYNLGPTGVGRIPSTQWQEWTENSAYSFSEKYFNLLLQIWDLKLFKNSFSWMYSFSAVLGLHCCSPAFSSCGTWGLLFVDVQGPLIAVTCCMQITGSKACGLQ